jgi:hypothetical protein
VILTKESHTEDSQIFDNALYHSDTHVQKADRNSKRGQDDPHYRALSLDTKLTSFTGNTYAPLL